MSGKIGIFFLVVIACAAAVQAGPLQLGGTTQTVWSGVYTAEQAERGAAAYGVYCSGCHNLDLAGNNGDAPALKGNEFMERWREFTLEPLLRLIKTEMPPLRYRSEDTPVLSDETHVDIIAHLLKNNGFPAGSGELTVAALDRIQIVNQYGPAPPPNHSLVLSVGCLATTGDERWWLLDATEPVRSTMPDVATPKEIEASRAKSRGVREFRLTEFGYLGDGFDPYRFAGQKIQVKGYLIRQTEFVRISITSLTSLANTCD
jgi:hypothetical protein